MPSSVRDFWSTLVRLRIVDASAAEQFARQLSASGADDPVKVAKSLIAQQRLTKFQAKRLLADRGDELVQGDFLVLDRAETEPLSRWFRARRFDSPAEVFLYPCSAAADSRSPVDLAWLQPHTMVLAAGLQPIRVAETAAATPAAGLPWRGLVVSELPPGNSLAQWSQASGSIGFANAIALGEVVGGALAAMHAAGLFHGGLRPGRVWIADDSSVYLLRTASGPPIFPGAVVQPTYDWFDDDGQSPAFSAPEWLAGQSHADSRSDVYSLAALIYHVATGQSITPGQLPTDIATAVAMGAGGDPMLRVLGAALALNPHERFQDVPSFLHALAAVQAMVATPTVVANPFADQPPAIAEPAAVPPSSEAEGVQTVESSVPAVSVTPTPKQEAKRAEQAKPAIVQPAPLKTAQTKVESGKPAGEISPRDSVAKTESTVKPLPAKADESPAVIEPPIPVDASEPKPDAATRGRPAAPQSPPRRLRKRNRRNRRGPIIIGSSAVAVLLLLVAIVMRSSGDSAAPEKPRPMPRPTPRPVAPIATTTPPTSAGQTAAGGFELVRDEKTLWVPPWPADSVAPPLEMVIPGAQAIISIRPKSLLRDGAEADWLAWLGQDLEPALGQLSQRAGVEPKGIDRLVIGMVAGADGEPTASIAVWLAQPTDLKTLRQKWGVSASKTPTGETLFAGDEPDSDAYFIAGDAITDATIVSSFAVGSLATIRLIAEGGGGAIPLSRPLQTAWDQTSESADLVAMVVPNFLFADGRKMLQRFAPRSIEPLKNLLIPNVTAAVLTIDTRENWYGEVKLLPGGGTTAAGLARTIQDRTAELPALAESFLVDSDISPSWRAMAIRLPQYLRAVNDQSRYGVSATLATANFYLPAAAAPQVTLASLLAMATSPQSVAVVASTTAPTTLTIEQMLDMHLSISFEQESLEFAVAMIGDEFSTGLPEGTPRPKITIIGGDLEKSGITQNQQVRDFKMSDVPLRHALTRLVAGANPDKTVTKMTEEKQSLVWVVAPASNDQNPALLITTRPQAAAKGYQLPQEFIAE